MWSASSVMMRIKAVTRSLHSKKSLFRKEGFPPNKLADRQGDLICFYHKPAKQLFGQEGTKSTKKTTTDPHAKTLRRKEKKF
ncbi:MAG: hypothetical protein GY797_00765 [Deltaproteobacteria bacterium]|nr:hypothetical protein [Deltaproteobacteria bacterium]